MAVKTPIKATFTGSDVTGLAEYQSADFIGVADGGTGAVTFTAGLLKADGVNAFTTVTAPTGDIVGTSDTQTLTNKTIDASSNTITNLGNSALSNSSFLLVDDSSTSTTINLGETLQILGGTGISSTVSGDSVTIAIDGTIVTESSTDTLTNKTIDSANNTLTLDLSEGTLTGTTAEFNSALSDGSFTTLAGTETLTNKTINSASNTITVTESDISDLGSYITASSTDTLTNKTISGSSNTLSNIGNSSLTNSSITVTDGSTSTATSLGGTITFNGTSNEIEVGESSGTITIGLPSDVTIGNNLIVSGNLTVSGTTTTVNTETINLADNTITLNSNETGTPSQDGGIEIERGTSANKTLIWNETTDKWTVGSETFVAGTFEGALTGNVTGDVTGNADTATSLETARTIGGVSFDGTANINLPGVNTSGTQDTSGNAATATALETARTIAGQSFDGTSNITIASTDLSDTSSIALLTSTQTLTNKTISGSSNTLTNIGNSSLTNSGITIVDDSSTSATINLGETLKIATGSGLSSAVTGDTVTISLNSISASDVGNGDVDNTELSYLNGVTSAIQTQLDAKADKAFAIAQAVALG